MGVDGLSRLPSLCVLHWAKLTFALRAAILREYRRGQEKTKRPTVRYMAVQRYAVGYLAFVDYRDTMYGIRPAVSATPPLERDHPELQKVGVDTRRDHLESRVC